MLRNPPSRRPRLMLARGVQSPGCYFHALPFSLSHGDGLLPRLAWPRGDRLPCGGTQGPADQKHPYLGPLPSRAACRRWGRAGHAPSAGCSANASLLSDNAANRQHESVPKEVKVTSSSASEASLAASTRWGRQEDAKDSACPMLTSGQPLAKPRRRLPLRSAVPAGRVSLPQDAATFPPGRQTANTSACASLYPSPELPRTSAEGLARLGEPRSSARNGRATVNTYGLVIKS